jgi:hypothetical protein
MAIYQRQSFVFRETLDLQSPDVSTKKTHMSLDKRRFVKMSIGHQPGSLVGWEDGKSKSVSSRIH